MSTGGKIFKIALPIIIIVAGAGVMTGLLANRKAPEKAPHMDPGVPVRVIKVGRGDRRIVVKGTGTVRAAQVVTLMPQVSGRVEYVSEALVTGGFFKKGELLFRIEGSDYLLEVERAEAARVRAQYNLTKMESQAEVARREWERIKKDDNDDPNPLVLYTPQLKDARAALKSAEASLEQARLNLKRTELRAPFNCRVSSEEIEPGQFVREATAVAVLSGTDDAEIDLPLPLNDLHWLKIPRRVGGPGSRASVVLKAAEKEYIWQGRIVRSLGEVDTKDRMMHLIISVKDPYGIKGGPVKRPPLSVGAFVDMKVLGSLVTGVFTIPRRALRDGSTVWTVDKKNRLRIKRVEVLRLTRDEVIIKEGLDDGVMVVLTAVTGAADGMKLRPEVAEPGL